MYSYLEVRIFIVYSEHEEICQIFHVNLAHKYLSGSAVRSFKIQRILTVRGSDSEDYSTVRPNTGGDRVVCHRPFDRWCVAQLNNLVGFGAYKVTLTTYGNGKDLLTMMSTSNRWDYQSEQKDDNEFHLGAKASTGGSCGVNNFELNETDISVDIYPKWK